MKIRLSPAPTYRARLQAVQKMKKIFHCARIKSKRYFKRFHLTALTNLNIGFLIPGNFPGYPIALVPGIAPLEIGQIPGPSPLRSTRKF